MKNPERYSYVMRPGHPLAGKSGSLQEHRYLLFERIGPGSHACYHCGVSVEWRRVTRSESRPGVLYVDHLDGNRRNNDLANLVPSCARCNGIVRRNGHMISDGEDFLVISGSKLRAVRNTCPCGREFLVVRHMAEKTRCCSRSCAQKLRHGKLP